MEENIGENLLDIGLGNDLFGCNTLNTGNRSKNKQVGLYEMEMFLHSKRISQDEKTTYGMGENVWNHVSDKMLILLLHLNSKNKQTNKNQNPIKIKQTFRLFPKKRYSWLTDTTKGAQHH